MKRQKILLASYYAPIIVGFIRIALTLYFVFVNPMRMSFVVLQVITLIAYIVSLFTFRRMYSDSVPIISVLAPTMVQLLVTMVFKQGLVFKAYLVLVLVDILYLALREIKSSKYPFYIEGSDDSKDVVFDELFNEAE